MRHATAHHYRDSISTLTTNPTKVAYEVLHWGFVAAPAIAGADKFTHYLVDWDKYLAAPIARMLPMSGHTFMLITGVVELAAAFLVAIKPKIGAMVVAGWLCAIIANLLIGAQYYDIALRDFGLMLGALGLGYLAMARERGLIAA